MRKALALAAALLVAACSDGTQEAAREVPPPTPPPVAAPAPPPPPPPVYRDYDGAYGMDDYDSDPTPEAPRFTPAQRPRSLDRSGSAETREPIFDDVVSQLMTASFAYSWPDRVNIEDRFEVTLGVNPTLTPDQVREAVGGDSAVMGEVRISRVLIARLSAPDFIIEPITPERQAVDANESTLWKWELEPMSAGEDKEIGINVIAVVEVGPDRVERYVKSYEGVIVVEVTRRQQLIGLVQAHWQWAFSALIVPAGAWLIARWRRRKRKGEPEDV